VTGRTCGFFAAAVLLFALPRTASAQTVTVTVPASITFTVSNVTVNTVGSPADARVGFSGALLPLRPIRISVKADAASFTSPSPGVAIPASKVRWTTANASGGTGSNGTVSATVWTQLFQSNVLVSSGRVDVTFILDAPGGGIRAGSHTLTIRYKIESI